MAKYRDNLPQLGNDIFACYTGMDTELLYNRRIDLPGFASYPLLSTLEGKIILREYYSNLVELAREQNVGVILDSVTWVVLQPHKILLNQYFIQRFWVLLTRPLSSTLILPLPIFLL